MKVCVVSSCGGHLTEVRVLLPAYGAHEHFYVVNRKIKLPEDMEGRTYFVRHSERDWLTAVNFFEALRILRKERPTVILSTGAGVIVPFSLAAKALRIPVIFVETLTRVREPSLSGRLMYHLADRFYYQWPELARYFPKGICGGPLV